MFPSICPVCKHRSLDHDQGYIFCTNCDAYRKPLRFYQKPIAWSEEKWGWWWRTIILLLFLVMFAQNLQDYNFALQRLSNPFSAFDLGMHELGHILFTPFGDFMRIFGGSLFQIIVPILWLIGFLQVRWSFAAAMCWCWLGLNFFDVATYAGDAQTRILPLATGIAGIAEQGSEEVYDQAHDWYQILTRIGHLEWDQAIAQGLRLAGVIAFVIGLVLGAILVAYMLRGSIRRRIRSSAKTDTTS
jgi:di/tricarboxylate transporter